VLQFVSAIAGHKDMPLVTAREAATRVKVMEALYQAARQAPVGNDQSLTGPRTPIPDATNN